MNCCGYNVLPIIQQRTKMHKDIELTRMDNEYDRMSDLLAAEMELVIKNKGPKTATYIMNRLAIEMTARHFIANKVMFTEEQQQPLLDEFYECVYDYTKKLLVHGEGLGLFKRKAP